MAATFFGALGADPDWFVPTELARGPWDPDACHAGPPTAVLVRALERALPELRLARVAVDLGKPVPMAGFRVLTTVIRSGRATGTSRAEIVDGDGSLRATATGMHVAASPVDIVPSGHGPEATPRLVDAAAGDFPIGPNVHGRTGFRDAVSVRYPPGEGPGLGPTTVWMRTVALIAGEVPSPFQRSCPLADCGNAFSRHAGPSEVQFVNTDLIIALHRDPVGDWLGSRVSAHWQPTGVGLADALLFDDQGPVGRALQTLLLRPAG
ncbi:MAG: thioesterase family protein [Ilumatobacteraceae bacterium]